MPKRHSRNSGDGSSGRFFLVLDAGTSGIKAFVFDENLSVVSRTYEALPKDARGTHVEQDAVAIAALSRDLLRRAVHDGGVRTEDIAGLGITNQRETTVLWNRRTGKPLHPAIVWEDRRTAEYCRAISEKHAALIRDKTGLSTDPYFSASKIRWLLKNTAGAANANATLSDLACGTIDSWLMWNLVDGSPHLTDHTNASRTLLFNIKTLKWDTELLALFDVPAPVLPAPHPSLYFFGNLSADILGRPVPLVAVCGDQQGSLVAAGRDIGATKVTYGTGIFLTQVLGETFAIHEPFFTTLAPTDGAPLYALEAKIEDCGARVSPLVGHPKELTKLLRMLAEDVGAYLRKLPMRPREVVVDGGVLRFPPLVKIQADVTGMPARAQSVPDGTALGTAMLMREFLDTQHAR